MYTVKMTQSWAISILKNWKNVGSYWNKIVWKTIEELNELLKWYKGNNPSEYLHWLLDKELELDIEEETNKLSEKELKEWKRNLLENYEFASIKWADFKALKKSVLERWAPIKDIKWADFKALKKSVLERWAPIDWSKFERDAESDIRALRKNKVKRMFKWLGKKLWLNKIFE